ncbi:MAG: LptF/LptG family permease [Muribaculaceae bacterium]|nr:LptF/LptG family permease [Muribaculaceae bacterium]
MLKTFLPLFAMTFFIVLFIVLMQFLWKYIDDLVGKGLSMDVLGELFFYAAVSMVPMALPLAILLASLMTFGNLGEKFELTAMKASGISLVRVMAPLIVTVGLIAVGAFFFQNDVLPKAQVKMWTLLFSMRQKSPELEIPEDVFYDQIPGFNLYVKGKDKETGMLRGVMIYDVSNGGDNATIISADSARLAFTPDMRYLYLHLYQGEQFENLRDQNNRQNGLNTPFRRETFLDKQVLIPFDANFNRLDEEGMRKQYVGKNIDELLVSMDSMSRRIDSIGEGNKPVIVQSDLEMIRTARVAVAAQNYEMAAMNSGSISSSGIQNPMISQNAPGASDSLHYGHSSSAVNSEANSAGSNVSVNSGHPKFTFSEDMDEVLAKVKAIDVDTLIGGLQDGSKAEIFGNAMNVAERRREALIFRAQMMDDELRILRRNDIELIKKFTLSVACIIFFFIGAPLGAIIRKGGLGTPLVISVLLFVVYYIIDNTGYKMARDGKIEVWIGMWLSTFILAPLGVYVTWKAMNDSAVFDKDRYVAILRKLVGARSHRSVASKEVIINDITEEEAISRLYALYDDAKALEARYARIPSYKSYWLKGISPEAVRDLSEELESTVDYLTDCRDPQIVGLLGDFPVLRQVWVYQPSRRDWLGWMMMLLFLFGLPIYFAGLQARRDLLSDCRQICERCRLIVERFGVEWESNNNLPENGDETDIPMNEENKLQ